MTLPTRSLLTRIVLSLVAAFVGVFFVLGAIITYLTLDSTAGQLPRQIRQVTQVLGEHFSQIEQPEEMVRVGALLDALQRENEPRGRLSWTVILDRQCHLVYAPPGAPDVDWQTLKEGMNRRAVHGTTFNLFAQTAPPWRIVFVDDGQARQADVILQIAKYLLVFLAVALILVLAPIWFATRSGLSPLRQLSEAVGSRRAEDLRPIDVPASYQELDPLITALNVLMATLAQAIEREKTFVQAAAHELRTPLAVITTQAHLLAHADDSETRSIAERQLLAAVKRASHLVHQLLRLAQLDASQHDKTEAVDVMALARDCLADFATRPEYSQADLGLVGPDALPCHTDRAALQSIIENLLDNALRYGGDKVKVDLEVQDKRPAVQIRVIDNGPGIPESMRTRVFERFYRANTQGQPGSGLGLSIVAEAVRSMHGTIELNAGPEGHGCCFEISLPMARA